ncbi:unnamed protein product [Phytophthora fragariaefolia]|uniref:Unnamed protein product n=1 Tax=Phytophthora fragariaefolia TaxID=1490495 RepID=A0A9W6WVW6_9STRA|nr:unnamed protein product [Phytophthora fragariaefolia]
MRTLPSQVVWWGRRAVRHGNGCVGIARRSGRQSGVDLGALNLPEQHQQRYFASSSKEENSPPEGLQETQVDLVEFLLGAKYAMEITMMAMYSREFADYVAREAEAPGGLEPDCEVAKMLHQSLETVSYDAFKAFLQSSNVGIRAEITEIEMHSAHLMNVKYARVPKRRTTNSSGAKVFDVPVQERLKLAVIFDITRHVRLNLPDSDDVEDVAVRRNKSIWQFDSDVSRPGDIDWTIEPLHLVM